ncbi:MAG: hypothetical protein AB7P76_00270 [Candidatus Melainabacteria bacterium]
MHGLTLALPVSQFKTLRQQPARERMPEPAFGMTMAQPMAPSLYPRQGYTALNGTVMPPMGFRVFVYSPATGGGPQTIHPGAVEPGSAMARGKAFAGHVVDTLLKPFRWVGETAANIVRRMRRQDQSESARTYRYRPYHR